MRLLHSIRSVNPAGGGAIESVRQFAGIHERHGHQVQFVSMDAPDDPWVKAFPHDLVTFGPVRVNYGYSAAFTPWLARERGAFDAVIVHGLWLYNSFGTWRALHDTETPYFVFPHGMLDPWFKQRYPLKHLKKCLYWPWGEYRVLRDAAAVFFTAEEECRRARESFRFYRARERVLSLGVERPPASREALREAFLDAWPQLRGKRLLLFLGRLHEKKGCATLIEAFAAQFRSSPELQLVMAGPGTGDYPAKLRALASQLGVADSVTWTGMLSGDRKWGALCAADAFVLPSHQENFGVAVVEALACQTPVLISNRVNIWREIVEDGAGFAASPDLTATSAMLSQWLGLSAEKAARMKQAADQSFRAHFEAETAAALFIEELGKCGVACPQPAADLSLRR